MGQQTTMVAMPIMLLISHQKNLSWNIPYNQKTTSTATPPFQHISSFLDHYFSNKKPATRACFVLPRWPSQSWYRKYVVTSRLRRVHTFFKGEDIFRLPARGKIRPYEEAGPIRWPVDVYIDDALEASSIAAITSPKADPPIHH